MYCVVSLLVYTEREFIKSMSNTCTWKSGTIWLHSVKSSIDVLCKKKRSQLAMGYMIHV